MLTYLIAQKNIQEILSIHMFAGVILHGSKTLVS